MSKTTWYIIGAIIVIGIIWYAVSMSSAGPVADTYGTATSTQTTTTTTGSTTTVTHPSDLSALLASAGPQTCTFATSATGSSVQGTIYVANGKLRGDITTTTGNKITYAHTIMSTTEVYTWIDGQTVGVKSARTGTSNTIVGTITMSSLPNFSCTNTVTANADFTKFNLPTGITFQTSAVVGQ